MGTDTISYLILYSFLLAGVITALKTRFYQTALSLLVFSSTFVSFLCYTGDIFSTLMYGSLLAFLPAYLFYMQYERPFRIPNTSFRISGYTIISNSLTGLGIVLAFMSVDFGTVVTIAGFILNIYPNIRAPAPLGANETDNNLIGGG